MTSQRRRSLLTLLKDDVVASLIVIQELVDARSPIDVLGAIAARMQRGTFGVKLPGHGAEVSWQSLSNERTDDLGKRRRGPFGGNRDEHLAVAMDRGEVEVRTGGIVDDVEPDSFLSSFCDDEIVDLGIPRC